MRNPSGALVLPVVPEKPPGPGCGSSKSNSGGEFYRSSCISPPAVEFLRKNNGPGTFLAVMIFILDNPPAAPPERRAMK